MSIEVKLDLTMYMSRLIVRYIVIHISVYVICVEVFQHLMNLAFKRKMLGFFVV